MECNNNYDVAVVGGGFSGCAAAIAAARQGNSVILFEQSGVLGGAAVNNLINPFMPWYTHVIENGERVKFELSVGIFKEICERLREFNAIKGGTFHEEYLKIVLDRMMKEAGVQVLFHSVLCDVSSTEDRIDSITVITKSGKLEFFAKQFIDCTGDADLAVMSGCSYRLGRESDNLCQPMTLCFRLANIDKEKYFTPECKEKRQAVYKRWQAEGKTSNPRENILCMDTLIDGVVHFNTTRIVKLNPVDPFDVSIAEVEAREQMLDILNMLREEVDACKDAKLLMSSVSIGARESRMINGEHILNESELKDCTRFDDAVAAGNYDIDIHSPDGSGTSHYYFKDGEYYTIPYRCLLPKEKSNLLVAGRCISTTHEAQASIRIMPIVCCLGEAAGVAAAVSNKTSVDAKYADVKMIQKILKQGNAFIGI